MNANHARFLNHLDASLEAVMHVAQWLVKCGKSVRIAGVRRAPSQESWQEYVDSGDLEISERIEVKRLSREFSDINDWPFGSKFIVCAKHAWDAADIKPKAFVILSKSMKTAAVVKRESADSWYVETRTDSRYDAVTQEFYLCPLDQVEFMEIEDTGHG